MSSITFSNGFLELYRKILVSPQETSLSSLLEISDLSMIENPLENIRQLKECLSQLDLELIPNIDEGTVDELRIIKVIQRSKTFDLKILDEIIEEGENFLNEFKSTLFFDINREIKDMNATLRDLKSELVLHSTLKTIAGFLNWEGGNLIIGVDNKGDVIGVEKDYLFFNQDRKNVDGWEIEFRNQINGKFEQGNSVNQHLDVKFVKKDELVVAVIKVSPRKKLSFVKSSLNSEFVLYVRQGNSTRQVSITECEEFIALRNTVLGMGQLAT